MKLEIKENKLLISQINETLHLVESTSSFVFVLFCLAFFRFFHRENMTSNNLNFLIIVMQIVHVVFV